MQSDWIELLAWVSWGLRLLNARDEFLLDRVTAACLLEIGAPWLWRGDVSRIGSLFILLDHLRLLGFSFLLSSFFFLQLSLLLTQPPQDCITHVHVPSHVVVVVVVVEANIKPFLFSRSKRSFKSFVVFWPTATRSAGFPPKKERILKSFISHLFLDTAQNRSSFFTSLSTLQLYNKPTLLLKQHSSTNTTLHNSKPSTYLAG